MQRTKGLAEVRRVRGSERTRTYVHNGVISLEKAIRRQQVATVEVGQLIHGTQAPMTFR
jgi:hypothetical protein